MANSPDDFQLIETGKNYWLVCKQYRSRKMLPQARPAAVHQMAQVQQSTRSPAVLKRVNRFIETHHRGLPSNDPNGAGPSYA